MTEIEEYDRALGMLEGLGYEVELFRVPVKKERFGKVTAEIGERWVLRWSNPIVIWQAVTSMPVPYAYLILGQAAIKWKTAVVNGEDESEWAQMEWCAS